MNDVIVIGGGLGGLVTATELARRGLDTVVLEAAPEPGGVARTVRDGDWLLEPAASSLILPHPHLTPIVEAAGVVVEPAAAAARRRFVYDRGRLVELRESPAMLATPLVGVRAKLRAASEPVVRRGSVDDESLAAFLRRRFGAEVGTLVSTMIAHGVFAGDPDQLSAEACFPAMVGLEREAGSIVRGGIRRLRARPKGAPRPGTHVARGGMSEVAQTLADHLGDRFRPGWPVASLEPAGDGWLARGEGEVSAAHVVVTTAPEVAAGLVPDALASALRRAVAAPAAVVGLGGRAADVPIPNGFGVLAGPHADVRALGVLFESGYASGRAPAGHRLAKAIYGGAADRAVMALDDEELVDLASTELGRIIGVPVQPTWTRVIRHRPGIPQYTLSHLAWLEELDTLLAADPGLHLGGWSYRGIGLSGLAADAVRLADRIETGRP